MEKLQHEVHYTRAQLTAIYTAAHAPLWVTAVQAEMQAGQLSNLTLPLLEKLRFILPEDAEPLLREIRARQGITSEAQIDLDVLKGDQRLFAGVLNAAVFESSDPMRSTEILVDA